MHYDYLAMAPNYFGFGATVEAAKARLKAEGGKLVRYVVYRMPEHSTDPTVDGMGRVGWQWEDGYDGPPIVELEVVAKRGV